MRSTGSGYAQKTLFRWRGSKLALVGNDCNDAARLFLGLDAFVKKRGHGDLDFMLSWDRCDAGMNGRIRYVRQYSADFRDTYEHPSAT